MKRNLSLTGFTDFRPLDYSPGDLKDQPVVSIKELSGNLMLTMSLKEADELYRSELRREHEKSKVSASD